MKIRIYFCIILFNTIVLATIDDVIPFDHTTSRYVILNQLRTVRTHCLFCGKTHKLYFEIYVSVQQVYLINNVSDSWLKL